MRTAGLASGALLLIVVHPLFGKGFVMCAAARLKPSGASIYFFFPGSFPQKKKKKAERAEKKNNIYVFTLVEKLFGAFPKEASASSCFWSRNLMSGREEWDPPTSGQFIKPLKAPASTLRKELPGLGSRLLQALHLPRIICSHGSRGTLPGDGCGRAGLSPQLLFSPCCP